jgi:hypothetical protein
VVFFGQKSELALELYINTPISIHQYQYIDSTALNPTPNNIFEPGCVFFKNPKLAQNNNNRHNVDRPSGAKLEYKLYRITRSVIIFFYVYYDQNQPKAQFL